MKTGELYILLGAGYGMFAYKSDYILPKEQNSLKVVYGSDANSEIHAIRANSVKVVSIDGQLPKELLDLK